MWIFSKSIALATAMAAICIFFLSLTDIAIAADENTRDTIVPAETEFKPVLVQEFTEEQGDHSFINEFASIQNQKLVLQTGGVANFAFQELSQAKFDVELDEKNSDFIDFEITLLTADSRRFAVQFAGDAKTDTCQIQLQRITEGDSAEKVEQETLRTEKIKNRLPKRLRVDYSFGLLTIYFDEQRVLIGYYKHPSNAVDSLRVSVADGTVEMERLSVFINATQSPELTEVQKAKLSEADLQNKELMTHYRAGQFIDAAKCGEQVLAIRREVLGQRHRDYAASLNNLAALYYNMGDHEKTAPLFLESAEVRKLTLGDLHPEYAQSLNNSAALKNMLGDYRGALPLFRRASEIWRESLGPQHYEYATSLHNLARVHSTIGEYSIAETLYQESIEIVRASYGEQHAEYATSLNNLGILYEQMGDLARAEPLYRQCRDIRLETLGKDHPAYASILNNLGTLYRDQKEYAKAAPLLEESLATHRIAFGENHTSFATSINNLALLYQQQNKLEEARTLFNQASDIIRKNLGTQHPRYADSLISLGNLYDLEGDAAGAEKAFLAASEIRKITFGDQHPDYAASLQRLARLYLKNGNDDEADRISQIALQIQRSQLDKNAIAQSARQQIANQNKLRSYLDFRLTNAVSGKTSTDLAAQEMWQWKGSVTRRQQAYRRIAQTPELSPLYDQLQTVTQRLSSLASNVPPIPQAKEGDEKQNELQQKRTQWQETFDRLNQQRESLERDIAATSEEYRRIGDALTVSKVQSALPKNTALIDILQYNHTATNIDPLQNDGDQARFVAFVIRPTEKAIMVSLGDAKQLSDAIDQFRNRFTAKTLNRAEEASADQAAIKIKEQLWQPIEKHLEGIDTILISGDTSISTLPFQALPGKSPRTFLIEDYRIASIPMAHQIAQIVTKEASNFQSGQLLVVGDVDYDKQIPQMDISPNLSTPLESAPQIKSSPRIDSFALKSDWQKLRANFDASFPQLAGFQKELNLIEQLYLEKNQTIVSLSGGNATKSAFLAESANSKLLHIITHGYFASPMVESEDADFPTAKRVHIQSQNPMETLSKERRVMTFEPGLLTGLAFAGANRINDVDNLMDDGILRSSEIEVASLAGVELVVLSACETGLGQFSEGEGVAGLQRAFQIAGASSVVASLWKVDDQATVELMKLFYTNLLQRGTSRLDAIREAQLTMLDRYDPQNGQLRGLGSTPIRRDPDKTDSGTPDTSNPKQRLSPRYWAAFQLSGDWR